LQDFPTDTTTPLIVARNLGKTYRDYPGPWARLMEKVTGRSRHTPIHALGGVDFELRAGESLAVLGENGAGKSTLLKILSGVTVPSEGSMEVRGRVASLLELGMGFHPELTGRQNIRLNAAMMGLGDAAISEKTPSIVEFSELGAFIDRPVKTYSTGMAMRLGFAVAAQLEPDVLIVDEALSVGDGYFQKKCMDRIRQLLDGGTTLLSVPTPCITSPTSAAAPCG
jgi:ABC-type polysaccharide/polyol phosphate transport system ATPase subunit